jgi:hypothetical protein
VHTHTHMYVCVRTRSITRTRAHVYAFYRRAQAYAFYLTRAHAHARTLAQHSLRSYRRMEQYTKHLLNILSRRYLAFEHLIHRVRDLSTYLSCNSAGLFSCARSRLVCVLVQRLSLLCVFLFPPYSCGFIVIDLVRVRGSNLWRFLTKGINFW